MKKYLFGIVIFGLIFSFSNVSADVGEQTMADGTTSSYNDGGIVNCGKSSSSGDACTLCHLVAGINAVVSYITGLVAVTAVLVITIAGVMYAVSAGNSSTTEMAKSAIKNAVIGVVITLVAFLIIHFVLKSILGVQSGKTGTGAEDSATSWSITCN